MRLIRLIQTVLGGCALGALAACAPTQSARTHVAAAPVAPACQTASVGDALIGNWLSVASQKGVAGSVRTLFTLNPDGTMSYVEQIKRPRSPSQGLEEVGCWTHDQGTLVLRTLKSNGVAVDLQDPIYTNRYQIVRSTGTTLRLQGPQGPVQAKRMSPGYRLPF